jgi:uncharacterized protein
MYWETMSTQQRLGLKLGACMVLLSGCHHSVASDRPGQTERPMVVALKPPCADAAECERRCEVGEARCCTEAGRLREFGHGGRPDPARAFVLYEKACRVEDAGGCYNAAVLLESGKGVVKDSARASELFAEVCRMGSKTACERAHAPGWVAAPAL